MDGKNGYDKKIECRCRFIAKDGCREETNGSKGKAGSHHTISQCIYKEGSACSVTDGGKKEARAADPVLQNYDQQGDQIDTEQLERIPGEDRKCHQHVECRIRGQTTHSKADKSKQKGIFLFHPVTEVKRQQGTDEGNCAAEQAECKTDPPGGIYCQHRPKSRRINDPAIKVVIVADRYGECDRLSSIKSDHSVLNQRDPLLRISKLQDPVMVEIKGIGRKYFREFNGIRLFPFRQKEGHPVSSAAVGRGICRTGKITHLANGKIAHIVVGILYFFRSQKSIRIKFPAGYQKSYR